MRVAAIHYINSLPLVSGLQKNPAVTLHLDTPAVCYQKLVRQEVDVALIPIWGTQMNSYIRAIKGLGIAATNRTESVYLFSKKPLDKVRTVTTDPGSMTSVMLLRIILREKYENSPELTSGETSNIHEALRHADAALIIGDDAILAEKTDYDHYDLATEWYSIARLPFVFAVWASNRALTPPEIQLLHDSYKQATDNWSDIYNEAQLMLNVSGDFLKRYYNVNLHYHLTRPDYEGLLKFLGFAAQFQFIDKARKDIWI
jgi:chorismate dehydratase